MGHASLPDGCNNPANHVRIEAELRDSIALAAQHGVPGLIVFSGNRLHGQSDLEGMVECARVLRRIAPYAEERGVNLNVELLNSRVDHPGYLCDRSDWGVALCEMVDSPRVKLLFDIYHMKIMEGDVIRAIRRALPHIGHFHTAGNPRREELDDTQELNNRGICSAIAETDYSLYVGHEFKPRGDLLVSLEQAYRVCDRRGVVARREPLRVGLVGYGGIGRVHGRAGVSRHSAALRPGGGRGTRWPQLPLRTRTAPPTRRGNSAAHRPAPTTASCWTGTTSI